ncbi:T9SS-dependent choice-of-anchor J family protein [Chryseobacterium sp.]|uniref:T9SS-dependent choice-of-anchor J family protein n=1 Tax=Chryseobacterium sp. TaxID=1871047 RepID=UPI002897331A|nr:choice-of-anchor J domain-containing protein [Chryseobacterium sp.]
MKKLLLFGSFAFQYLLNAQNNVYSYGFDSAFPGNWTMTNQSLPPSPTSGLWKKASYTTPLANPLVFGSQHASDIPRGQAGGNNSFAVVGSNSIANIGDISNWLISPAINVKDGDVVSFFTRKGTSRMVDRPDRLEVRYSAALTTVNPTPMGVGSFTGLGISVNPNLQSGFVYPRNWTKYEFVITGVGSNPKPVKFGFRYFVFGGGPSGGNSDLIGIDTFSINRNQLSVSESPYKLEFSISPNPVSDFLSIKSEAKIKNVDVFDMSGRKMTVQISDDRIEVKSLQPGNYMISITTNEGVTSKMFIKK